MIRSCVFVSTVLLWSFPVSADPAAFSRLLSDVPFDAAGPVVLFDAEAARNETAAFAAGLPEDQRALAPFALLWPTAGFDVTGLPALEDGGRAALGFSVFEIGQMAGWGDPPAASVVATGLAAREPDIAKALAARGFASRQLDGVTVWHRQEDHAIDLRHRNEEPFAGPTGGSERFAQKADMLVFSRDWQGIAEMLSGGLFLADDTDAMAIVEAAQALPGAGSLVSVVLVRDQPVRIGDPAAYLLGNLPASPQGSLITRIEETMPPFRRFGLALWLNGSEMTGAVLVPYLVADLAEMGRDTFSALLDGMTAPSVNQPFAKLLPGTRRFEIVEAGDRAVLVLGFTQVVANAETPHLKAYLRNPQSRLLDMLMRRDLDMLIGQ